MDGRRSYKQGEAVRVVCLCLESSDLGACRPGNCDACRHVPGVVAMHDDDVDSSCGEPGEVGSRGPEQSDALDLVGQIRNRRYPL